jgi:polypeptide N-acetylgalactosaminyltransferase
VWFDVAASLAWWNCRLKERSGLIRARIEGAKAATGEVLVVLDSHCECNTGWLEPMLDRIRLNRKTAIVPVIDAIDHDTWKYLGGSVTSSAPRANAYH